jgi:hypothetical protein
MTDEDVRALLSRINQSDIPYREFEPAPIPEHAPEPPPVQEFAPVPRPEPRPSPQYAAPPQPELRPAPPPVPKFIPTPAAPASASFSPTDFLSAYEPRPEPVPHASVRLADLFAQLAARADRC